MTIITAMRPEELPTTEPDEFTPSTESTQSNPATTQKQSASAEDFAPVRHPYPALQGESKPSFLGNRFVQIGIAILVGFLIFLLAIFLLTKFKSQGNPQSHPATTPTSATKSAQKNHSESETPKDYAYVNSPEGLNLREEPNTSSRILTTLPDKTQINILAASGDWYQVEATARGYVSKKYVTKTKPTQILKIYENTDPKLNFVYPEKYTVDFESGSPDTFNFTSHDSSNSSGGFTINKEASGLTISGYIAQNYAGVKPLACDITLGNADECRMVKTASGTFYLISAASSIYQVAVLTNFGDLPFDLTQTIFRTLFFY